MGFYLILEKRVIPPPWHEDGITGDGWFVLASITLTEHSRVVAAADRIAST